MSEGGRLGGNHGRSAWTMTLISVRGAHYPTSLAKHVGLVCMRVLWGEGW